MPKMANRRKPSPLKNAVSARRGVRPDARGAASAGSDATVGGRRAAPDGLGRSAGAPVDRVEGLARGGVPEIQRARILAALVEVARERGAGGVTVARVVARSGVSRRTFYELFEDRDACFLAAFDDAVRRAATRVVPAFREGSAGARGELGGPVVHAPGAAAGSATAIRARRATPAGAGAVRAAGASWRPRVRAGLLALLEFLDDEPGLGGLCVVDALGAGPAALERRAQVAAALVDAIDEGRGAAKAGLGASRLTAEGVVGGVLSVLYARLAEREHGPLIELLNPLMGMIVLPYLGAGAAAREAARAAPRARRRAARAPSNPLEGLDMRMTYRTVRVLIAIAERPAASNRQVADAAGVQDQGQISKLLARLEHLGLIENTGSGYARGEPNAWRLTSRGREVELTIRQQAGPANG
jgi:AcrR family transcriptional regulator